MPTYDYKCLSCGDTFEFFQKMTDEPLTACPKCNGEVKRLLGTGLRPIFKGSGFYETDYKSNGSNNGSSKTTSVSKNAKTENTKSENKGADKKSA